MSYVERGDSRDVSEARWDAYLDVALNGTAREAERWTCWFERRFTQCQTCKPCRGSDPFE